MTTITAEFATPRQAHAALNELFQQHVKPRGGRGRFTWETESAVLREKLRNKLNGIILPAISEQVYLPDPARPGKTIRYAPYAWKTLIKSQFGMTGSSEALSNDRYGELVTFAEAFAADLGVVLPEEET